MIWEFVTYSEDMDMAESDLFMLRGTAVLVKGEMVDS